MNKFQMKKDSRKIDLLLALGLNAVFLAFFMCFYEMLHETNDDWAISYLLEGAYGEYTECVVYQNVIWARFVIFLNKLIPQIKWYMVIMFAMLFTNFVSVTYAFFRILGRRMGTLVNTIMVFYCGYHTYVLFQYSRVATVVTAGGLLVMFYALEHAACKKEKWILVVLGGILAVWGSMIRFPMFGVAVVLAGGSIGLYKVWCLFREKKEGWLKEIGTYVAVFGCVGVISLGCYVYDSMQYSSDEYWVDYMEYNDVRTELWDYGFPDFYENIDLYYGLGITENDYGYYRYWNIDPENLTMDVMHTLADAKKEKEFVLSSFLEVFPRLFEQHNVYTLFVIFALIAIGFNKKNLYFGLYGYLAAMVFEGFFMYLGRCALPRVDCGMWIAALFGLVYGASDDLAKIKNVSWKWVAMVVGAAVALSNAHMPQTPHEMSETVASTKKEYEVISNDKDHLYIVLALAPSVYYGFDYWEPCEVGELSNIYNAFGWEQKMKVKDKILENYGIENIYTDSVNNEKVYFIAGSQKDKLEQYLQENYDPNLYLSRESEVYGIDVWGIRTRE